MSKEDAVFFIAVSMHLSQSRTPRAQVQFELREQDFFGFFPSCDGSAGCLFLSLALIRKCSQHGVAFLNSRARRDAILSLLSVISRPCLRPRGTQIFMSFNVVGRSGGGLRLTALISPTEAHSQVVHELQTVCKLTELAGRDLKQGERHIKWRNNTRLIKTIR